MVKVKCKVKDLMKILKSQAFRVALEAARKTPTKNGELWLVSNYGNGIQKCHITRSK